MGDDTPLHPSPAGMAAIAQDAPTPVHAIDAHFARNTIGVSGAELFWGLGLPVVLESTFLQLFLRNYGASSTVIGLLPTMFSVGIAAFSLTSAYLTARLTRRRGVVVLVHVLASLPLAALGLALLRATDSTPVLGVFLAGYGAFCLGMGLLVPLWQDYVVRVFSDARVLPALSVMMTVQSVARIAGSYGLLRVVERFAFSARSSGAVFLLVSVSFVAGSFMFLLTREPPVEPHPSVAPGSSRLSLLSGALGRAMANRAFLILLGTDLEYFALSGVMAFYANFATEHCGISPALASGLFVASIYVGTFVANVLLGWFDLLTIRHKYVLTKSLAVASIPLLCFVCAPWAFLLASFLIGLSRGTRQLCFGPAVRRVAGQHDATTYFAVAPPLTLLLSAGIPLANGGVLDALANRGAASYRIVFLSMAALMLVGLALVMRLRLPGEDSSSRRQ